MRRIGALWQGMSGPRRLLLAASFVALSTAGGAGLAFTLDDFGREVGTQPHASGPAAAHQDDASLVDVPAAEAQPALNGTALPASPDGPGWP